MLGGLEKLFNNTFEKSPFTAESYNVNATTTFNEPFEFDCVANNNNYNYNGMYLNQNVDIGDLENRYFTTSPPSIGSDVSFTMQEPTDQQSNNYGSSSSSVTQSPMKFPIMVQREAIPEDYFPEQEELENYTLIKQIGQGAFAKVFKAVPSRNGSRAYLLNNYREVAIKVARKPVAANGNDPMVEQLQSHSRHHQHHQHHHHHHHHRGNKKTPKTTKPEEIMSEVAIHRTVSQGTPQIVQFLDFQESPSYYFVVLEKVDGGELFDQIIKYTYLSEDLSRHVIRQVALAVKHLHVHGVVHRDIKPENILFEPIQYVPSERQHFRKSDDRSTKVDEGMFFHGIGGGGIGTVKLTDFGLSKLIYETKTNTPCGTLGYTAPEVIREDNYSMKVDMWGIGCVLYTILCGFPPFFDDEPSLLRKNICEGNYTFLEPWWNEISIDAKRCVSRLLEVDPARRYDVDDLLNDPWLNSSNYDAQAPCEDDLETIMGPPSVSLHSNDTTTTPVPSVSRADRTTMLHNAFVQSNDVQRSRDDKRQVILDTGMIAPATQQTRQYIGEQRFQQNGVSNFLGLNLQGSSLWRKRNHGIANQMRHSPLDNQFTC